MMQVPGMSYVRTAMICHAEHTRYNNSSGDTWETRSVSWRPQSHTPSYS